MDFAMQKAYVVEFSGVRKEGYTTDEMAKALTAGGSTTLTSAADVKNAVSTYDTNGETDIVSGFKVIEGLGTDLSKLLIVIVTDGNPDPWACTKGWKSGTCGKEGATEYATKIKKQGAQIMTVGFAKIDREVIDKMSSSSDMAIYEEGIIAAGVKADAIFEKALNSAACKPPPRPEAPKCTNWITKFHHFIKLDGFNSAVSGKFEANIQCQASDVGPGIDKAFLAKWGYEECDKSSNGHALNMDVQKGSYNAASGVVNLKWFGHGLVGEYSVKDGTPQIYWPGNGNVWKCVVGLEHALKKRPGFGGTTKKWYDGLYHDNQSDQPGALDMAYF